MSAFTTQFGESFVGAGVNAAHINTILGAKGGPVETAWATALAHPTQGHTPFVAVLRPGLALKPFTLFVNKATITANRHAEMTWGPAQAGVAKGGTDAAARGIIEKEAVDTLLLTVAGMGDPGAGDGRLGVTNHARATV